MSKYNDAGQLTCLSLTAACQKVIPSLLFVFALLISFEEVDAQAFTGTYTFGDSPTSQNYNGTTIPNLIPSAIARSNSTLAAGSASGTIRFSGWPTGATNGSNTFTGSIDTTKYIGFTLTASADHSISMSSVSFTTVRSNTGPRQFEWRSSVDNYASVISTYTSTASNYSSTTGGVLTNTDSAVSSSGNVLRLTDSIYANLTAITLRLYAFNAEAGGGTGGLDTSLTFSGATNETPELGSLSLFGSAVSAFAMRRRRTCQDVRVVDTPALV